MPVLRLQFSKRICVLEGPWGDGVGDCGRNGEKVAGRARPGVAGLRATSRPMSQGSRPRLVRADDTGPANTVLTEAACKPPETLTTAVKPRLRATAPP